MADTFYASGSFEFRDGTFATQYVAYVLGRANDQDWGFSDGTALIYGLQAEKFFAHGYATFGNGSAYLSSDPVGAFEDFAMYPEAQPDPVTGFVLADNSGTLTSVTSAWSRHYRVVVPPKNARFVVPHIRFGSVAAGISQYLDAHQLEVVPVGQTTPSAFMSARSVVVKVRPARLNYYAGNLHVTNLVPGRTYIASGTVAGKRKSYTLVASATGTADLNFGGTATQILVEEGTTLRPYFDGNSGDDYLWENGGSSGRSYYYPDRVMRHYVLVRNLQENVALGMTVQPPIYATLPAPSSTA